MKDLVKKAVNHLVFALAVVVLLGGLKMGWDAAPGVVDAVNVVHLGGWDAVREAVGVAVVDTLKALVVLAVGVWGYLATRGGVRA